MRRLKVFWSTRVWPWNSEARSTTRPWLWLALSKLCVKSSASTRSSGIPFDASVGDTTFTPACAMRVLRRWVAICSGVEVQRLLA